MDCSPQGPLSVGFSRQEDWNGLPFPPPGDLPDQGSNCDACSAGGLFTPAPPGKPMEDPLVKIKDTPGRSPSLPSTWPQVRSATEEGALFSRSVNRTELCNPAGPCAPATKETLPSFSLFRSPLLSSEMCHIASLYVLGQYGCQINSESGSGNKRK